MRVENIFFLLHAEVDIELKRRIGDFFLSDLAKSLAIEVSPLRAKVAGKIYFNPLRQFGGATDSAGDGEIIVELAAIKTNEIIPLFFAAVTAAGEIFVDGEIISTPSCSLVVKKIVTKKTAPKSPVGSYIFGSVRIQYRIEARTA